MTTHAKPDWARDLILPALLFAALGAMAWAVRGCSGFGAVNGCLFAGVTWGAAWWYLAHDPTGPQRRPYSSGWVILALTVGIGIAGNRGWMQWSSFFEGRLQLNTAAGQFAPIPRGYGFLWLFLAGVPWAGLGACLLAWCAPRRPLGLAGWGLRLACGLGAAGLAQALFDRFPEWFLPLYSNLHSQYADLPANPNLRRLINDNRAALLHLGAYLGFLAFELGRRDFRNVVLILTVGIVNGIGWALCQNWKWAPHVWPGAEFNFWRCWESSGGISIGLAYGLAYYLVNRPRSAETMATVPLAPTHPNLERFGAYLGLVIGLGFSLRNGLKGWANLYLGREDYWERVFSWTIGPLALALLIALAAALRKRPLPAGYSGDLFPHAYRLIWLVLIVQNAIAQCVTGPHNRWSESAFSLYYLLLFALTGAIVHHERFAKQRGPSTLLLNDLRS